MIAAIWVERSCNRKANKTKSPEIRASTYLPPTEIQMEDEQLTFNKGNSNSS